MNAVTKVATLIVATGLITTLVLPGRQTDKVLNALFGGVSKWQSVAMGTGKA